MAKKETKEKKLEYVLVPVAWLARLIDLSNEEGVGAQHLKGYISSADPIILNGKRVSEKEYYNL